MNYGDIFFTRSSLVKEGIAFSNVYLGVSNDITYDGHLIKLSPDLNIIEPKFLNYCLKVAYVRKQLIQGENSNNDYYWTTRSRKYTCKNPLPRRTNQNR